MAMTQRQPPYREGSFNRSSGLYSIEFTAANPVVEIYQDEGGTSGSGSVTITRLAAGEYRLDFPQEWLKVIPVGVQVESDRDGTEFDAGFFTVVEGSGNTNSAIVQVTSGSSLNEPGTSVWATVRLISSHGS